MPFPARTASSQMSYRISRLIIWRAPSLCVMADGRTTRCAYAPNQAATLCEISAFMQRSFAEIFLNLRPLPSLTRCLIAAFAIQPCDLAAARHPYVLRSPSCHGEGAVPFIAITVPVSHFPRSVHRAASFITAHQHRLGLAHLHSSASISPSSASATFSGTSVVPSRSSVSYSAWPSSASLAYYARFAI